MSKKEIKKEELENVDGGYGIEPLFCPKCNKEVIPAYRYVGEGCDKKQEYYCRDCETVLKVIE